MNILIIGGGGVIGQKLGRALAVGEAHVYSEGEDRPVARSSLTYSIPPER